MFTPTDTVLTVSDLTESSRPSANFHPTIWGDHFLANPSDFKMKNLARGYFSEAKWCHEGHIPTMDDYMSVGIVTSAYPMLTTSAFLGMGDIANKEAFDWVSNDPKIVRAASLIGRFMNDIVSHKDEQERGHVASAVECYMKQHGVIEEHAINYLRKKVRDAWKDINQEFLKSANVVPVPLLERILNLTRTIDVMYKDVDSYTNSSGMKDSISSMFVELIPI